MVVVPSACASGVNTRSNARKHKLVASFIQFSLIVLVAPLRETLAINRASGLPKQHSCMSLILRMLAWLSWFWRGQSFPRNGADGYFCELSKKAIEKRPSTEDLVPGRDVIGRVNSTSGRCATFVAFASEIIARSRIFI